MMAAASRRGDTIVEVIVAFAIFALLAVSTTYLMNRSLSVGQRSLELTLARQQIDTQAELLRYVRDVGDPTWDQIKANVELVPPANTSPTSCPTSLSGTNVFALRIINGSGGSLDRVVRVGLNAPGTFEPADYYSRFNMSTGVSQGLWITPVRVEATTGTYDMYIQSCWDSVGSSIPQTLSTIVRLYET